MADAPRTNGDQLPRAASGASAEDVARRCATAAGDVIRRSFGSARLAGLKGRGNVLTETDLEAERTILAILAEEFPDHRILAEESAPEAAHDGWTWVIDPLDGTKNFSQGIPHFCVSIALCRDGDPILGIILQPVLDEVFFAVAGRGATLDGLPIRASSVGTVEEGILAVDLGYDDQRGRRQLELALAIFPRVQSLRIPGSAALGIAYAAVGRYDLFLHSSLYPWDLAAGLVIAREAGATVTDRTGQPATILSEGLIAGAPKLHADFIRRYGALPWQT
jgi:fructose-1,6-bisphosphatase/inositol monophosphatase family enzyme